MHFDPSLPDVRHSPFREPPIVQRSLHNAGGGHKPVAPVTAGGFVHLGRMDSQPDKVPSPRARSFPLFPVAQPHTPPQPLVQFRYFAIGLTDTEVVQPTHQVYVDDRTIDSHIKRLRKKFKGSDDDFDMIETLYGVGYRFKEM